MSLASGLGALPFLFFGKLKPYWAGIANAIAVGVMMTASFDLLHEGAPHSPALTVMGMVIGALFIKASQDYLSKFEDASFEDLSGADARKAMLIIAVMAAHAFGEGSGVGVSFSGDRGWAQGLLVTIAIGLHNIPEGMAVAGVMMSKGSTPTTALYWTLLCALPQTIVAVPSYLFVESFTALMPVALGFAAGCMVWISFAELLPDALESADHGHVATAASLSAAWLQGLSMMVASLEQPGGSLASPFAADPKALTLKLVSLMPSFLVPCFAAAAASWILPMLTKSKGRDEWTKIHSSLSLSIGLASGTVGLLGLESILFQLLNGSHIISVSLSIFSGVGLTALIWASVIGPAPSPALENEEDAENPNHLKEGMVDKEWLDQVKHQHQSNPSSPPPSTKLIVSGRAEGVPVSKRHIQSQLMDINGLVVQTSPSHSNVGLFLSRHHQSPSRRNSSLCLSPSSRQCLEDAMKEAGSSVLLASLAMASGGLPSGLRLAQASLGIDPQGILSPSHLLLSSLMLGVACGSMGKIWTLSSLMTRHSSGGDTSGKGHKSPLIFNISSLVTNNFGVFLAICISCMTAATSGSSLAGLPLVAGLRDKDKLELADIWAGPLESAVGGALLFIAITHLWPLSVKVSEGSSETLGGVRRGGRLVAWRGLVMGLAVSICCSILMRVLKWIYI